MLKQNKYGEINVVVLKSGGGQTSVDAATKTLTLSHSRAKSLAQFESFGQDISPAIQGLYQETLERQERDSVMSARKNEPLAAEALRVFKYRDAQGNVYAKRKDVPEGIKAERFDTGEKLPLVAVNGTGTFRGAVFSPERARELAANPQILIQAAEDAEKHVKSDK